MVVKIIFSQLKGDDYMSLFGGMFDSLFNAVKSVFSSAVSEEMD